MTTLTDPAPATTTPRPQLWLDLAVFVGVIAVCFRAAWAWDLMEIAEVGHYGTALAAFAVWRVGRRKPFTALSAPSLYLGALCLFHFGLTSIIALGIEPTQVIEEGTWIWLAYDQAVPAARVALMGVAACAAGMTAAALTPPRPARPLPGGPDVDRMLGYIGAAMVVVGVTGWAAVLVRSAGPGVFLDSYAGVLDALEGTPISALYLMINVGVPLLAATTWGPGHRFGAAAFAVFSILGFPVGLRGEVLFPLAAVLVVRARRGLRLDLGRLGVVAAILLGAAALTRDVREFGLGNVAQARSISANPLNGVMELGGTLRPVAEVIRWYEEGDDYIWGASYLAPFDRPLRRIVPGLEYIPAENDDRIMHVLAMQRDVGAIGFSPIAEAYRNFGTLGTVLVMALTGFLVGRLDQLPRDPTWNAMVGVVFVPILTQVRNSFISLPSAVVIGALVVLATSWRYGRR